MYDIGDNRSTKKKNTQVMANNYNNRCNKFPRIY